MYSAIYFVLQIASPICPISSSFPGSVSHSLPLSLPDVLHISVASLLFSFILLYSILKPELANERVCLSVSVSTGVAHLVVEALPWITSPGLHKANFSLLRG